MLAPFIVCLAPAIDCRASLSLLLVKVSERERFPFAPHIAYLSHSKSVRLLLISLSAPLSSTHAHFSLSGLQSWVESDKMQQQLTGASAGKPQVFETKHRQHPAVTDQIGSICLPGLL